MPLPYSATCLTLEFGLSIARASSAAPAAVILFQPWTWMRRKGTASSDVVSQWSLGNGIGILYSDTVVLRLFLYVSPVRR